MREHLGFARLRGRSHDICCKRRFQKRAVTTAHLHVCAHPMRVIQPCAFGTVYRRGYNRALRSMVSCMSTSFMRGYNRALRSMAICRRLAFTITYFLLCRPLFAMPAQEMARPAQEVSAFMPFRQEDKKYEIAQVDKNWDLADTPSARFWYPFSKAGGEKAMRDEEELLSSCFSRGRAGLMKYRRYLSVSDNNGPMKVYAHCSNLSHPNTATNCYVMVRFAPTLRVLVKPQPEEEHNTYGPHARIELRMWNICSCLLYTSPSPRDKRQSRMPSSA
mgnify:CR=1 FL=1